MYYTILRLPFGRHLNLEIQTTLRSREVGTGGRGGDKTELGAQFVLNVPASAGLGRQPRFRLRLGTLPAAAGPVLAETPARTRRGAGCQAQAVTSRASGGGASGDGVTRPRPHRPAISRAARHFVSSVWFAVVGVGGSVAVRRLEAGNGVYCLCLTP